MNLNQIATIEAIDISYGFSKSKANQKMISDITLSIFPGEFTLINGDLRSGKSTLLAMISGLLPLDGGKILIADNELGRMNNFELDRFHLINCGFIFQRINLSNELTVLDNLLLSLSCGITASHQEAIARATKALNIVGLKHKKDIYPKELRDNEKQRVAIASAIVKSPRYLFADEPTRYLDNYDCQIAIDILSFIAHNQRGTVVVASQDNRLIKHADRIITLKEGKIIHDTYLTHNIMNKTMSLYLNN
ncbi:lipoprotein ABC transporter ATP-binding protein [Photorhabdus luminescens]|uniref:ABC transporter ATP-binding protein n=1 Tax=Photorhabdus akhurstii TaxID=171438 RepID=UPI000CF9AAD5|nr:lipoprotein ABC transporter ATP-binding protein [Photorhabdus luminescens]PQQ29233.1 lipoprotein ABC transporter ATP-binding protein [Photorhabdus luminescens]